MNRKLALYLAIGLGLAVVLWMFPLFHVVTLQDRATAKQEAQFDAASFAKSFWDGELRSSLTKAPPLADVIAACTNNFASAKKQFGHGDTISDNLVVLARTTATVATQDSKSIAFEVSAGQSNLKLTSSLKLVFGNLVRDASGLLDIGDFSNSQDWNDLSKELNRMVETNVLSQLKQATVGETYQLVVGLEIAPEIDLSKPFKVVIVSANKVEAGESQ